MQYQRQIRLALSMIMIAWAGASTAQAQNLSPILVAYAGQNETVGPMWVGIERGTFRKYGLDVRLVQLRNSSLIMATLSYRQVHDDYGSPGHALRRHTG